MSTEYPDAPQRPDTSAEGIPENVQQMLACLPEEDVTTALRSAVELEAAVISTSRELWMATFLTMDDVSSHVLGHTLQVCLASAEQVLLQQHGSKDLILFAPSRCDVEDHQLTHDFVEEFTNDVLNRRYEDSMDRWRSFLAACQGDYLAYVNGVYGVCNASVGVVVTEPTQYDLPEIGSVLQIGQGGVE